MILEHMLDSGEDNGHTAHKVFFLILFFFPPKWVQMVRSMGERTRLVEVRHTYVRLTDTDILNLPFFLKKKKK